MKSGRLVVRRHSPVQRAVMTILTLALIAGSGYGLYSFGNFNAGYDRQEAQAREKALKDAINELERQNLDMRDRVALLDRSTQVDKQAYQDVNSNLRALQEEVLELREEAAFYRGIVSPLETSAGLRVERLELVKTPNEQSLYHYNLVLTQVLKNQRNTTGNVTFSVQGTQNGKPRTLSLGAMSVQKENSLAFKFRYFQKLEGDLLLPEGFVPRSVDVTMSSSRNKDIGRSFNWDAVVKGGTTQADSENLNVMKEE